MTHIRRFVIALVALVMFACSSAPIETQTQEPNTSTVQQGLTTSCTTNADCTGGVAPKCGDVTTGKCVLAGVGGAHACNYSFTWPLPSGCQCLEGDIQSCKTGAYPTYYDGIQTCNVTSTSPLTTSWGSCAVASPTFYGEITVPAQARNCTSVNDCDEVAPECADGFHRACQPNGGGTRQCQWLTSTASGCNCIQWDVRSCTIFGGGAGHQQCNDWSGNGTTLWNVCQ